MSRKSNKRVTLYVKHGWHHNSPSALTLLRFGTSDWFDKDVRGHKRLTQNTLMLHSDASHPWYKVKQDRAIRPLKTNRKLRNPEVIRRCLTYGGHDDNLQDCPQAFTTAKQLKTILFYEINGRLINLWRVQTNSAPINITSEWHMGRAKLTLPIPMNYISCVSVAHFQTFHISVSFITDSPSV